MARWVFYAADASTEIVNFINGNYDGDCVFYTDNGLPGTHMMIRGYKCTILDAWGGRWQKIVEGKTAIINSMMRSH